MSLSTRQLAKLRQLGRLSNELGLRHEARRAAIATQRAYLVTLQHKLEQLPKARAAALREGVPREQQEAAAARCDQEEKRVRQEIQSARGELEHLQEQLRQITRVSAPNRELIERLLVRGNLSRHDAGIAFGDGDTNVGKDTLEVG